MEKMADDILPENQTYKTSLWTCGEVNGSQNVFFYPADPDMTVHAALDSNLWFVPDQDIIARYKPERGILQLNTSQRYVDLFRELTGEIPEEGRDILIVPFLSDPREFPGVRQIEKMPGPKTAEEDYLLRCIRALSYQETYVPPIDLGLDQRVYEMVQDELRKLWTPEERPGEIRG